MILLTESEAEAVVGSIAFSTAILARDVDFVVYVQGIPMREFESHDMAMGYAEGYQSCLLANALIRALEAVGG